jgi:hypothetical protein
MVIHASTSLRLPPATVPVTLQEQTKGFWKANDVAYEMISVKHEVKRHDGFCKNSLIDPATVVLEVSACNTRTIGSLVYISFDSIHCQSNLI